MNFFILKFCFITLILCLLKVSKATEYVDISKDFKVLLMFCSEAFLKGAVFDGKALEGEIPSVVARKLVEAIENVEIDYTKLPDLVRFKNQLAAGIPITEDIYISAINFDHKKNDLRSHAVEIQRKSLKSLEENNGIIIPIGWKGHALALVIKKGETSGTFDFAVVNTGQGLQFHYHAADPNGVYPRLSQIWIEFNGVKKDELFSNEAWFFQGLIALKTDFFENKLKKLFASTKKLPEYYPEYFYGSFLANFQDYLVPHRDDRLFPMQRSGSCALSSLIGALLYTSESEETFYLHRLKIGQSMTKSFLAKAKVNEKFKTLITDGFETNGRNFLKGIGSSLAHKTLEYLEFALPKHFKHAGLIGSGRFKWIFEKKEAANKALMESDPIVYESIKTSIQIVNDLMNFLKENPISVSSNDIILTQETRNKFEPVTDKFFYKSKPVVQLSSSSVYTFLNGTCTRPQEPLRSLSEFYEEFTQLKSLEVNSNLFYRILNVFQRAHELIKEESFFNTAAKEQILELLITCKTLARYFASFKEKIISFDDIVLMIYLQKLAWKLAVEYDNKMIELKLDIGLRFLAAPQTIQNVLFGSNSADNYKKFNLLAGNLKKWTIYNCFDQKNVEIFLDLLKHDEMESSDERFMGPESFCRPDESDFKPKLPESEKNRAVYMNMMGFSVVEKILRKLVDNQDPDNKWSDMMDISSDNSNARSILGRSSSNEPHHGKFIIVFSKGRSELIHLFPQYYNLMDTLETVRIGSIASGNIELNVEHWTADDIDICYTDPDQVEHSYVIGSYIPTLSESYYDMIRKDPISIFDVNNNYSKFENRFFKARHSLAFMSFADITSVETWFNYIKSSSSANLFDSTYFQYISDHLLNVPKFDGQQKVIFPLDEVAARSIIEELSRLIRISLGTIKVKNEQISSEKRKTLIIRAVNVSVILTRFISRIDLENILTGAECAKSLAHIYNLMIPFANFKTEYCLAEPEISRINFALAHICTVFIRNSLTFMNNIKLETNQKSLRKTLKRYHWFAAKKGHVISGIGTSVADDQFNYGRSDSPLNSEETNFLKNLLMAYFLPGLGNNSVLNIHEYNFSYNYEMYLVRMQNQTAKMDIIINLWTGAVVYNEICLINSSIFFNSPRFQNFFASEDLPLASGGIASEFAGKTIYALPDFKGASYLLIREHSDEKQNELTVHRKWNGNWYELISSEEMNTYFNGLYFDCDWIKKDSLIFERRFDNLNEEIIVILKDEVNPIMRLVLNGNSSTLKVVVDGFVEGSNWTILSREENKTAENSSPEASFKVENCSAKLSEKVQFKKHTKSPEQAKIKFQKHLDSFTNSNYILAKDDADRFVIICMNLRFPDDMRRPIVFREIRKETDGTIETSFEILNIPNTEICANQSLGGSSSLPGGLVIISDSKKELILTNEEKTGDSKPTIVVEKIPVLNDEPAPQTRMHKILLAYYLILQFEFNSARKLLNPSVSIHQNYVLSIEEINILKWITKIDLKAPEALALKLFAYLHYEINRTKFQLEHEKYELKEITAPETSEYLFSLREMSEKYYVFLKFPIVNREPLIDDLFLTEFKMLPQESVEDDDYWDEIAINDISNASRSYNVGDRIDLLFLDLVLSKDSESMNLVSKLMLRRGLKKSMEKKAEMAAFCYVNDHDLWTEFDEKVFTLTDKTLPKTEREKREVEIKKMYRKVLEICIEKYKHLFKGVNQSSDMSSTRISTLKSTFESEALRFRLNIESEDFNFEETNDVVSPMDIQTFTNAELTLRNLLKSENVANFTTFDAETAKSSNVLAKLENSIRDFVLENGQSSKSELNIDNIISLLNDLLTLLLGRINEISIIQEVSASELTAKINAETCSSAIGSILGLMHQRKVKTFESLYACYLKDSLACIQNKLPQLSLEQCADVKEKAKVFYGRQILLNYFGMLQISLEKFLKLAERSEPVSADDLNIFCDELVKIKDFNSKLKNPVIMNFEFKSKKYRLKPEQVMDVELLTAKDPITKLFLSVVIQRMMAAGKTLILGTYSVVKKALDSKQLSILVPPSSLYQSNTTAIQNRTYLYFKKKGITFNFPRFKIPTKENADSAEVLDSFLSNIIEIISNTMKENNYLILSPESLHSFLNSYIEILLYAENNWSQKYQLILIRYAHIYLIFKQRGSIIMDEIDMTMDPKKELNFPTQEVEPYNMVAVTILTDIIEFMVFDENIIKAGLRIHSNNQASLTATSYRNCVDLILSYIESQLKDTSSLWHNLIYGSISNVTSVNEIIEFLRDSNMAANKNWITELHSSGNEIIADALIILKYQLHHQMEHALNGTVNQNFGSAGKLRPDIKYAVPYAAANTPSNATVFSDRWETLLKTLLMVSASPCSLEIAKDLIDYARNSILNESVVSESLQATATYKNMKHILPEGLCPMSLDSKNILHVQAVQQALAKRSPAAIRLLFTFYITQVFDRMTFPTEQITSNALNVASMFNSVQGYSGTIDNVNILPQHVVKDAYEDNMRNEKNNGGISLKLINDCDNGVVQELNDNVFKKSAEEMVRELMSLYPSGNVSAIIDTGAFFKNFKNIEVAKAILSVFDRIKVVLYYDEDSNQLEFLISSEGSYTRGILETTDPDDITRTTQVEINSRFTFYDQRHITGSDIPQPKTAHALMTAGPRVLLRDILQGALRMRQFMTSQKVHLVITEPSRKFYCNKIMQDKSEMRVSDILALGAINEDDKQEDENVKLAFGKINAEIRAFVLDEISRSLLENSEDTQKFVLEMTNTAKKLFLRLIKEVPLNWLKESKDENTTTILNSYANSYLNPVTRVISNFSLNFEIHQRFNDMKKRIKDMISPENKKYYYNKETIRTSINLDAGSEVQQQSLTLLMVDLNMDNQLLESATPYNTLDHANSNLLQILDQDKQWETLRSTGAYINFENLYYGKYSNEKFKPYLENALVTKGSQIGITFNLIDIAETHISDKTRNLRKYETEYPIFSEYTVEGTHFLVQLFENNLKVLLISSKHASSIARIEIFKRFSSKFWLCDLSGSVTATNDQETRRGENILDFIPQIDNLMFDLLAFNGSLPQILANTKLKAIYDNWLKSDHFKMRAMFLRLRMKALLEREKEIFEADDKDLRALQEISMGFRNSIEKIVDGYPKYAIEEVYETQKIELLGITTGSLKKLDIAQNESIKFDIDAEIRQLLEAPIYTSSKIPGPDFVDGSEDLSIIHDNDIDEREIPAEALTRREIIHVQNYGLAKDRKAKLEHKSKDEIFSEEILNTEIFVDDSMPNYKEPDLTDLKDFNMTESNVSFKPEQEKSELIRN